MTPRAIFLAKLTRAATPRPAVGSATSIVTSDLQAAVGVSFPLAHRDADAMARLAEAGHTVLGFDNVMPLFSVWHESAALGCPVDWGDSGHMPAGRALYASLDQDPVIPDDWLERPAAAVPIEALRLLCARLGDQVAVVGKVFGPWTLGYHLYGVENFLLATLLAPERVRQVMRALVEVTVAYAQAQIEAGADALCLADHCTRDLCSPAAYADFLLPIHQQLHRRIACPVILHICGHTADRLPHIRQTGFECFHFDSAVPADEARRLAGDRLALMGGTANIAVLRRGTPAEVEADVAAKIAAGIDILGPECAVPLDAPYANLAALAAAGKRST